MERIISRSELASASASSTPNSSPEPQNFTEKARASPGLEFIEKHENGRNSPSIQDDEEMDFRLFAPISAEHKSQATQEIVKIKLQSPDPSNSEPGFVNPSRDHRYYFTRSPSISEKEKFQTAAVTGPTVIARSHSKWPGCAYSWKVIHLPVSKSQLPSLKVAQRVVSKLVDDGSGTSKRKRLGKKSRIKCRTRLAAIKKKQTEEQRNGEEKAAAEREKRTRRNREKKVKKKIREKAKKAEQVDDKMELSNG